MVALNTDLRGVGTPRRKLAIENWTGTTSYDDSAGGHPSVTFSDLIRIENVMDVMVCQRGTTAPTLVRIASVSANIVYLIAGSENGAGAFAEIASATNISAATISVWAIGAY